MNFHLSEFMCHDGSVVPKQYYKNVIELAENLQVLRGELSSMAKKPVAIHINSAYRTKKYNAMIGGTTFSKHLIAQAADITTSVFTPKEIADTIEKLILQGRMIQGGLGRYPNFTHTDIRRTKARWGHN